MLMYGKGHPLANELGGLPAAIRTMILEEITRVANFADGSDELAEFNGQARSQIMERWKDLRKFLNSPPGFGFRGSGAEWFYHLKHLQKMPALRKRLTLDDELEFAEKLLDSNANFWREYIETWGLLKRVPYGVASRPDPELLATSEAERTKRIDDFITHLGHPRRA
jgi:hypothetical protein